MRRRFFIVIGALAFAGVSIASGAHADDGDPATTTTTIKPTTTTTPPSTVPPPTSPPTTAKPSPTTTVKGAPTTTTTLTNGSRPIPPPASGASQPLDPSLLGGVGPIDLDPSTTTTIGGLFGTDNQFTTTTVDFTIEDNSTNVSTSSSGPSGAMLGLAAVAWLATLGGLLIYAEDQRGKQWRHLAR
jgi:hypothetical protein